MSADRRNEDAAPTGADDEQGRAVDAALTYLSYRPRTHHEIRRKLAGRGFSEDVIEAAIERLDVVGLVDDPAFVASYVRDRISHRPMGVRRMVNELYAKGIPREVAVPVIESVLREEGVDERQLAQAVAERKYRAIRARCEPDAVVGRRLRDHLARRGFNPGLAREVAREVIDGRSTGGG